MSESEEGMPEFKTLIHRERKRTYIFPDGKSVSFTDVVAVCVRASGTHRLELSGGRKVIVRAGWLAIELDVDEWSF